MDLEPGGPVVWWVREGRGGGVAVLLKTKPRKQEARGAGGPREEPLKL